MKVKDFIEKIRPLTALNPETELTIHDKDTQFNSISILIDNSVELCFN